MFLILPGSDQASRDDKRYLAGYLLHLIANTIVGPIVGIIGLIGYIFAAVTYLLGKAHLISRNSGSKTKSSAQKSSIPYRRFSLVEWKEMLGQGVVNTADFVISLFPNTDELEDEPIR